MMQQSKKLANVDGEQPKLKGKEKIMKGTMFINSTIQVCLLGNLMNDICEVAAEIAEEQNIDYINYSTSYHEEYDMTMIRYEVREQRKTI